MQGKIRRPSLLLLLAWMLPSLLLLPTAASSTRLTTSVPTHVSLTVEITGKGTLWVNGEKITQTTTLAIPRNQDCTISAQPSSGCTLYSGFLDGKSVTQSLADGTLVLHQPYQDSTLTVCFRSSRAPLPGENPPTGDSGIRVAFGLCCLSLLLLWQVLRRRIRRLHTI